MPSQSEDTEVRNNASGGNVTAPSQLSASHPEERNIPDNYQVADLDFQSGSSVSLPIYSDVMEKT